MQIWIEQYPELLALLIFVARLCDVSLGTFRTIMVMRGYRFWAAFIGFFEIMIWLIAAGQVLQHLDRWYLSVAYAAGFAAGNYLGILLESKLAIGRELVRCLSFNPEVLASKLRKRGYRVVAMDGDYGEGRQVEVLFIIEKRKNIRHLLRIIEQIDSDAIYSTTDVRHVYDGPEVVQHGIFAMPFKNLSKRR